MITLGAGNIVDLQGYLGLETFFIGWITVATISALVIWLLDYSNGGKYDISNFSPPSTLLPSLLSKAKRRKEF